MHKLECLRKVSEKKVINETQPTPTTRKTAAILHPLLRMPRKSHRRYKLRCYVADSFTYIAIDIDPSRELGDLKQLIADKQKERLGGCQRGRN